MSASAAGGMLMWVGGVMVGIGAAGVWPMLSGGMLISLLGAVYIRRFAERNT